MGRTKSFVEDEYEIYQIDVPGLKPVEYAEEITEHTEYCRCGPCKKHRNYLKIVEGES